MVDASRAESPRAYIVDSENVLKRSTTLSAAKAAFEAARAAMTGQEAIVIANIAHQWHEAVE